jgi:predicted enzyme related to lactoylglutathione lyase
MGDFNSTHNRAVWFDIPVADLDRAAAFYGGVLAIKVEKSQFDNFSFCVLEHDDGNGGCLVPKASEVASNAGILLYMNVDGRMREALARVTAPSCSTARAIASPCTRRSMPDCPHGCAG